MSESLINIIGCFIVCLLGLGLLWVLVLMVIGYRMIKRDMRKFRERERKITERSDKIFREPTK